MKTCTQCGLKYPDEETKCFVDGATLEALADPLIGTTLAGRYLIEEAIGHGGMATVYRARHALVGRPVAVKVMSGALAKDPRLRERFRREAKNAAALTHPHIIEIYDFGETADGTSYLVMEYLQGAPLSVVIEDGPIDPAKVAILGLQIAQGLARAHDFEVIHRDLKPDNIFISDAGDDRVLVKLLDFGIARSMHDSRLTNQGEIFGTPQYMAPERITTIDAGPGADLYSLGIILFEMVTGRLPFESDEITGFFIQHMQDAPPKPSRFVPHCPAGLEALILSLLAKKPEERPVDAHAIIKALQDLVPRSAMAMAAPMATTRSAAISPTLPPTTLERWARRAVIFDEMLTAAFPAGAPTAQAQLLGAIRTSLSRLHQVRRVGLHEERALEEHEHVARDNRARLGHAVQSLAEDLSLAREGARAAKLEVQPYFDGETRAEEGYAPVHKALMARGIPSRLSRPDEKLAALLRASAEALDRWALAYSAAEKARYWLKDREQQMSDLEFQVKALRSQLERTEDEYEARRSEAEKRLVEANAETLAQEQKLIQLAGRFCEPLRPKRILSAHFRRLEQQSVP